MATLGIGVLALGNCQSPEGSPEILSEFGERCVCASVRELLCYECILRRSAGNKYILDGSDTHVKIRGEGVENLMGAHVRVGVNDTLSIALDTAGYD